MFTRDDAHALLHSLPPMDFAAPAGKGELLEHYRSHYGLIFDESAHAVAHVLGRLDSGPAAVACHYFRLPASQEKGTAFLLHGYFDHCGLYAHLIRHCLDQGLSVTLFDLPGHGLSSGPPASIDSFQRYAEVLLECLNLAQAQGLRRPWFGLGQSTGGAVLMDALLHNELSTRFDLRRIILLAPLLRPARWWLSRLLFGLVRHFVQSTPRRFSTSSHDPEFGKFLRQQDALQCREIPRDWIAAMIDYQERFAAAPPLAKALDIVQGSADTTVDWRYNLRRIKQKFPGTRCTIVPGAFHHMVNESKAFREPIFGLVTQAIEQNLN